MAVTYSLAPNPKWYFVDMSGKPLGGGYFATFRNLDPTVIKLVYKDPAGLFPWPYILIPNLFPTLGIQIDENGTQGAFYFAFDSTFPEDTYFLEVYDSQGVLQWTVENFFPSGGGGGVVTDAQDLENVVINNVFWRNTGNTASPIGETFVELAPGAHAGLALTPSLFGTDIVFIKDTITATDQLQFKNFNLGDTPFTNDVTPVQYLNYTSNSVLGENFKYVQFPITSGVQNLSSQTLTFTIWARSNGGGNPNLTCQLVQFFGDGASASAPVVIPIDTFVLTGNWQKFPQTVVTPTLATKVLGECHNDGLFLQVRYPTGAVVDIDFVKPCLYVGRFSPDEQYETYDMIDAVINSPRTSQIVCTLEKFKYGFVAMDDGTIGSQASSATNRANFDTFPLYNWIWNNVNRLWAPVVGGAGLNAVNDFSANKPIFLTRALGRVFAGTLATQTTQSFTADFTTGTLTVASTAGMTSGVPVEVTQGGVLPSGLSSGVTYYASITGATTLRLAVNVQDAIAGAPVVALINNGTPPNFLVFPAYMPGEFTGEETHTLTNAQMPIHNHPGSTVIMGVNNVASGGIPVYEVGTPSPQPVLTIANDGGGQPHNNVQPTTYMNVFMKL